MTRGPKALMIAAAVFGLSATALVAASGQNAFDRLTAVRQELTSVKDELGMYNCCIAPTCSFCALVAGMCPCGDGAQNGDGVCGECLLGWHAGQGNLPGVDAEDVQPIAGDMLRMMYDLRAKEMGTASAGEGATAHDHTAH